jgi:thiopurine S-methyltransferase
MKLNKTFWEQKYRENKTGWDIGDVSTPIKSYIDQLSGKDIKILVPGGGNSYEVEYLWKNGFKNVYVIDIASQPLNNLKQRLPDIPSKQVINGNFFDLNDSFDLIIEQTFFCALAPNYRLKYARKTNELLKLNGKIVGLLFDFEFTNDGPPFGGRKTDYLNLFAPFFCIKTLERAYNSIKPRQGKELFFIFEKKESKWH